MKAFNFHQFDCLMSSQKNDPRGPAKEKAGAELYSLLFGAFKGDLNALTRLADFIYRYFIVSRGGERSGSSNSTVNYTEVLNSELSRSVLRTNPCVDY